MQTTATTSPARGLPDLNFDSLHRIISFLTRREVACLSRTCRTLRNALSPELPRGGVTLEGRSLTSFLQFADTRHGEDRLRYFHELVLPGSTYTPQFAATKASEDRSKRYIHELVHPGSTHTYESRLRSEETVSIKDARHALSTVLLNGRDLESLSIIDLNVFSFPPAMLKEMLNSLPRLRALEMSAVQRMHERALENLLPRLRTLHLSFQDGCDASAFLQPRPAALQLLELKDVALNNATFQTTSPSFPAVRTLRVCPQMIPSDIDALTRLFPNVEDVSLDFQHGYVDPGYAQPNSFHPTAPWTDPSAKAARDRLLVRPQKKTDAWPRLQRLMITGRAVQGVVWAGLTCHVPRLEVAAPFLSRQGLACVLGELRSDCVVLHPSNMHTPKRTLSNGWSHLRAIEGSRGVTRLVMILCQCQEAEDPLWHVKWWAEEILRTSSVRCLLVRLEFDCPIGGEELSSQLARLQAVLSGKIPSLHSFLFQIKNDVLRCWKKEERATRGGNDVWKEMSEDEGRRLIALEKMEIYPASIEPCKQCETRIGRDGIVWFD